MELRLGLQGQIFVQFLLVDCFVAFWTRLVFPLILLIIKFIHLLLKFISLFVNFCFPLCMVVLVLSFILFGHFVCGFRACLHCDVFIERVGVDGPDARFIIHLLTIILSGFKFVGFLLLFKNASDEWRVMVIILIVFFNFNVVFDLDEERITDVVNKRTVKLIEVDGFLVGTLPKHSPLLLILKLFSIFFSFADFLLFSFDFGLLCCLLLLNFDVFLNLDFILDFFSFLVHFIVPLFRVHVVVAEVSECLPISYDIISISRMRPRTIT